ncbi:hypothetical protein [Paenibacillus alkalitolerans]|uniref:hypothetical protein n=1 Tax=Paenibacillus alkalitolerans TaxID=2799335 RepID=UPI0018F48DC0|nr:hypothetical protein [Paenibacillus alkalitolerans]
MDETLYAGTRYVDTDLYYSRYYRSLAAVLEGWINNGKKMVDHFGKDESLSNEEDFILSQTVNDLTLITKGMYSETTKQEDPDMPLERFKELIKPVAASDLSKLADKMQGKIGISTSE